MTGQIDQPKGHSMRHWTGTDVEPGDVPVMPSWLTPEGREVWLDDVARVTGARERDSTLFAMYCACVGACIRAWRNGDDAPLTSLSKAKQLAEVFGIAGDASRANIPQRADGGG